jgi:hypothetical protein
LKPQLLATVFDFSIQTLSSGLVLGIGKPSYRTQGDREQ